MEDKIYEMARKRVDEKKGFYQHFSVYVAVGAFLFMINALNFRSAYAWWVFIMLPWGAMLTIHYFSVFGLPGGPLSREWEEKELRQEMDRIRTKVKLLEGPKQGDHLELPTLKKDQAKDRPRWNEDELV